MATIETREGQTLIVEPESKRTSLTLEARLDIEGRTMTRNTNMSMSELYSRSAWTHEGVPDYPRSRGDLTAGAAADVVDKLIGAAVAKGWADRRADVSVERLEVTETSDAKRVEKVFVPEWDDDWPADGSASDKVRFMLDDDSFWTDEQIAAAAGCSRSLVSGIKSERGDADG